MIHAACHVDHEKRVAWVPISMHTCGPFPIIMDAPLGGPSGRRSSAIIVFQGVCAGCRGWGEEGTRSSDPSKVLLLAGRFLCFLAFYLDVKERGNDIFQNKTPGLLVTLISWQD